MNGNPSSFKPWDEIGKVPVAHLTEARLQLHWAAQIVASFGNSLIERRTDDSQSNLGWTNNLRALCSHPSSEGFRLGLRLADLTLLFLDKNQNALSECVLPGKTLQQGFDWLATTYSTLGGGKPTEAFALRDYEMPSHPLQQKAAFSIKTSAPFQEFQHWYANAHHVLQALSENWQQASPVRCWPHHFDIATLTLLDSLKGPEEARSVGCGMSPGDTTYAEPYWYVNLWPYPDKSRLPQISVGKWHTEGWIGAILTASELVAGGPVDSQPDRVLRFFQDAAQASFCLLGANPY